MSRVQTGVRIEKGLLKVLKAVAEYEEVSLGALLESIVLHSFNGEVPFDEDALVRIAELSRVYGLGLDMAGKPDESSAAPELDTQGKAQEGDLAEALDGLSRMLGVDD